MSSVYAAWNDILKLAVKQKGQWACYVSGASDDDDLSDFVSSEIKKLYPSNPDVALFASFGGLFFFDSEADLDAFYAIFSSMKIDSSDIYACTYSPDGSCLTENT